MIRIEPREFWWATEFWPLCEDGLDPIATYGDESQDWRFGTHPADRYWAVVEDPDLGEPGDLGDVAGGIASGAIAPQEIGMAWASRYENRHMWTYGLALFPKFRGQAKGQNYEVVRAVTAELFADPAVSSLVTMVYNTNGAALRYNGMQQDGTFKGRPGRRHIGFIQDAGGAGVDLYLFQLTRAAWASR